MICAKKTILLFLVLFAFGFSASAQFSSRLKKANKEYELKAFNQAIESYLEVLDTRRGQEDPEALGRLADCYRYLNQMDKAVEYYSKAVMQRNVEPIHIFNYAQSLKALGRFDEAKRWFLEYAKVDPVLGNHFAQSCDFARVQQGVAASYFVSLEQINTPSSDFGPAFFRDQVVFASSRIDVQRSTVTQTGKAENQLYISRIGATGFLESPLFLKSTFRNEINEGPLAYSPDGRTVVFTKNNFVEGTRQIPGSGMELNLFIADANPGGDWINARPFPHNGTGFSTGYPSFSPDGAALYFASDRPGGSGGFDLYVSYRSGNSWSTPQNLGAVVNTPGNEITPFHDGTSLFFASDYHQGLGGFDIFQAEQLNGRWSRVTPMGSPVNSSYDDYGMIYDNSRNLGYFTSNRSGGRGLEDIYKIYRSADNVVIRVRSASDGMPVADAIVDFSRCGMGTYRTDIRGLYSFQAPQGMNCDVTISKQGFAPATVRVSAGIVPGSRELDVMLGREGETYTGKIIDYSSQYPVEGVTVIVTNQTTGNTSQVMTDRNGDYTLALSPNSVFIIRYTRPGYREINRTVRTEQGLDRTILSTITMIPSAEGPVGPGTIVVDPLRPDTGGETTIQQGFAVQIAALSKPSVESFTNLESIGRVYSKEENARYKIRVGVFSTRAEAEKALTAVKSRGYSGAFIVEETGGGVSARGTGTGTISTGETMGNYTRYMIQLGAFRNPQGFDDSKVRSLGYVTDKAKGNLTLKLLAGFSSVDQARNALSRVKSAGFKDAFIVEYAGGDLVKVK